MPSGQMEKTGVKYDDGKERFDLLPVKPLQEVAHVYTIGCKKYNDRNWEKGLSWGRVFAAMLRHAYKYWGGERYDRECLNTDCRFVMSLEAAQDRFLACDKCGNQGKRPHHLAAVIWGALALMEYETTHPEKDDRNAQN